MPAKKLERKIILTVMIIAESLILAGVIIYGIIAINKSNDLFFNELHWEIVRGMSPDAKKYFPPDELAASHVVTMFVDHRGNVDFLTDNNDLWVFEHGCSTALLTSSIIQEDFDYGFIKEPRLLFCRIKSKEGHYIACVDVDLRNSRTWEIIRYCLMFLICISAIVFALVIVLSKWVTRPINDAWISQQRFIGDASHALKTPISIISANAELLETSVNSEQDKLRLSNIYEESKNMQKLVNGLLSIEEVSRGTAPVKLDNINISNLATEAALRFESIAIEHGISLDTSIQDGLIIRGTKDKLSTLLYIFLDNAIKYVDENKKVVIKVSKTGKDVLICISNSSAPISNDLLEKAFTRFYQISPNEGNGLGLSIAMAITKYFGGKTFASYNDGLVTFCASFHLSGNTE